MSVSVQYPSVMRFAEIKCVTTNDYDAHDSRLWNITLTLSPRTRHQVADQNQNLIWRRTRLATRDPADGAIPPEAVWRWNGDSV